MGMLLTYRKGYWPDGKSPKGKRTRAPRKRKADPQPAPQNTPAGEGSYADLTDEEVFEAYTTTLPDGEATERDAQVVELRAVAAFAHTFDADPDEGNGSE